MKRPCEDCLNQEICKYREEMERYVAHIGDARRPYVLYRPPPECASIEITCEHKRPAWGFQVPSIQVDGIFVPWIEANETMTDHEDYMVFVPVEAV